MKKEDLIALIKEVTEEELIKRKSQKETINIGHDDEPSMIKNQVFEIAQYAIELYKLLDMYDNMEEEVNFPHWWQEKVIIAREEIGSAKHFLETETNQK